MTSQLQGNATGGGLVKRAHEAVAQHRFNAAIKDYSSQLEALKSSSATIESSQLPRDFIAIYCNRSLCYLCYSMWKKALGDAEEALKLQPESGMAMLRKVIALSHINDKEKEVNQIIKDVQDGVKVVDSVEAYLLITGGGWRNYLRNFTEDQGTASSVTAAPSRQTQASTASSAVVTSSIKPVSPASSISSTTATTTSTSTSTSTTTTSPASPVFPSGDTQDLQLTSEQLRHPLVVEALKRASINHGVGTAEVDGQIALGYYKVNNGMYSQAIEHFSKMLQRTPDLVAALLGRGTAYALTGEFERAEVDFRLVIKLNPNLADAYKRRAQVLGAMGKVNDALLDLNLAVGCDPYDPDGYYQRGSIHHKIGDHTAAAEDLQKAITLSEDKNQKNASYYNLLGMTRNSMGEAPEAVRLYNVALNLEPNNKESYCHRAQAYREWGLYQLALEDFERSIQADPTYSNAYYLRGFLRFWLGHYPQAIVDSKRAVQLLPKQKEAHYFCALAYHNLGQCRKACEAYDAVLKLSPEDAAWYNKQCCLRMHALLDTDLRGVSWDREFSGHFKEAWCKRSPPSKLPNHSTSNHNNNNNNNNHHSGNIPDVDLSGISISPTLQHIVHAADRIGDRIYLRNSAGFFPNLRQQRMCGLAVLQMAQTVRKFWQEGVTCAGPSCSGKVTPHEFGWRDLFDIAVKWRQIADMNDPVWWIDLLPEDLFYEGFGLQTPMITGHCKVPRYYPYYERCLAKTKQRLAEQYVLTDESYAAVQAARDVPELWAVLHRDFFVISPCYKLELELELELESELEGEPESSGRSLPKPKLAFLKNPNGPTPQEPSRGWMEGTRITIVRNVEDHGYQFTIRTAGTPWRYQECYYEMDLLWEALTQAVRKLPTSASSSSSSSSSTSSDVVGNSYVEELIVLIYYYWVNFQPLTRGSAACGLMVLLALFLASEDVLVSPCDVVWPEDGNNHTPRKLYGGFRDHLLTPTNRQPDWEGIITPYYWEFLWKFLPALRAAKRESVPELLGSVGEVSSNCVTMRDHLHALCYNLYQPVD